MRVLRNALQPQAATGVIIIPHCPGCNAPIHFVEHTDLANASGFINCDACGRPVKPTESELNSAALEIAVDELAQRRQLAQKMSEFFNYAKARRDSLMSEWLAAYATALAEWEKEHGPLCGYCHAHHFGYQDHAGA